MGVEFTPLSYVAGDTWYLAIDMEGLDTPLEEAYFSVKNSLDETEFVIQVELGDGIEVDPEHADIYIVRVDQSLTNIEEGDYFYDVHIGADTDEQTPLLGQLTVVKGVTK